MPSFVINILITLICVGHNCLILAYSLQDFRQSPYVFYKISDVSFELLTKHENHHKNIYLEV